MILDQWYAIARTEDVRKRPVGVRRFSRKLVLYRDTRGKVVCLDDRCAHKGVPLSRGKQHGDCLACPYHGFRYAPDGQCVHMPVLGRKASIPRSLKVRAHTVREEYGLIWFWTGEDDDEELPEVPMFREFSTYQGFTSRYAWHAPTHYTRYVESVCEVYHVPFVHRGSVLNIWDPKGGRVDDFTCSMEGTLIRSEFVLRPDDERTAEETLKARLPWTRGWRIAVDVQMPNMVQIRNDVFDVYLIATPIDDENCWLCICYKEPKRDLLFPMFKPLPIPGWRRVRPWLMCRMERFIQQAKDMEALKGQEPRISGLDVNNLIPVDKANAYYLRLRDRLSRQAIERRARREAATPASAQPERPDLATPKFEPIHFVERGTNAA